MIFMLDALFMLCVASGVACVGFMLIALKKDLDGDD